MMKYAVDGHEPSLLPEGWNWKLAWSDEFDGTELDRSKWDFRLHLLHTRHETFTTEGVELKNDSCVYLNLIEKDGQYYSPHLQTGYNFLDEPDPERTDKHDWRFRWPVAHLKDDLFTHMYGYYECRCRLQQQPGWWSAFWMQSPTIGCSNDLAYSGAEIDIMESFEPNRVITPCVWWNGYSTDTKGAIAREGENNAPVDFTPGFHYFGLLWEPDGYSFFYDGVQTGRKITEGVSQRPEFILISTECKGYRAGDGRTPDEELKRAVLPDAFVVDHVKVFDPINGFRKG